MKILKIINMTAYNRNCLVLIFHKHLPYLSFFLRFYLFIYRERGREGEREGEKQQCVVASHTPQTGDLARMQPRHVP